MFDPQSKIREGIAQDLRLKQIFKRSEDILESQSLLETRVRSFHNFFMESLRSATIPGTELAISDDGCVSGNLFGYEIYTKRRMIATDGLFSSIEFSWFVKEGDIGHYLARGYLGLDTQHLTADPSRNGIPAQPLLSWASSIVAHELTKVLTEALTRGLTFQPSDSATR